MSKRRGGGKWRRKRWWLLRTLIAKYGGRCRACGDEVNLRHDDPKQATADHVVPVSKGGVDRIDNLALLCRSCNGEKADSFWDEWAGLEAS